jgi:inosose dehydratase
MKTIAVNSWLFQGLSMEQVIKLASRIGYEAVEIPAGEVLKMSIEDLNTLKDLTNRYGLKVSAVNAVVSFVPYIHGDITTKVLRRRQEFIQQLKDIIGKTTVLDCRYLILSPGRQSEQYQTYDEAFTTTVESLKHLGEYASKSGVVILLEAMPFRYFHHSKEIKRIIDAVDLPVVRASIDTGHVRLAGEKLEDSVTILKEQLRYLHLSNVRIDPWRPLLDEHRPLNDGSISREEYSNILSNMRNVAIAVNVVTARDYVTCAEECLRMVKSLV